MKVRIFLPALAACLSACSTMDGLNQPLDGAGETNPLNAPGSTRPRQTSGPASFTPGQFVKAVMDNTAFFAKRPSGAADADKLLKLNTPMKVVQDDGSYVKVELEGGEVGFVPSVMVFDPNAPAAGLPGAPGDIQPLPPTPVPPLPTGGAGDALPIIAPGEAPPVDAVPAIVDPTAPAAPGTDVPPPPPASVTPATPPPPTPAAEEKKEQP